MDRQNEAIIGAMTIAFASVTASIQLLKFMAARGMVTPEEVEMFPEMLIAHFPPPGVSAEADRWRTLLDEKASAEFLAIRQLARDNWRG